MCVGPNSMFYMIAPLLFINDCSIWLVFEWLSLSVRCFCVLVFVFWCVCEWSSLCVLVSIRCFEWLFCCFVLNDCSIGFLFESYSMSMLGASHWSLLVVLWMSLIVVVNVMTLGASHWSFFVFWMVAIGCCFWMIASGWFLVFEWWTYCLLVSVKVLSLFVSLSYYD